MLLTIDGGRIGTPSSKRQSRFPHLGMVLKALQAPLVLILPFSSCSRNSTTSLDELHSSLTSAAGLASETCQFFNLPWGKNQAAAGVPVYTAVWIGMFISALIIALTGVRPLQLVDVSIIFGMVIMPLTYYPILRVAADKKIMGAHVNNRFDTVVGSIFLVLITAAAAAAIPLMIVTHSGKP
jgi:hypothetical protein